MTPVVLSANIAEPRQWGDRQTGIDKRPAEVLHISAPGPHYGDGSGVAGDVIGDTKHHGGAHKAVYAYAREELDYWERELDRHLPNGSFGENLTTHGIDLNELKINQQVRIGTTLLEVSVPRTPCRTFGEWVDVPQWSKVFTARGDAGSYFRVVEAGEIHPGDEIIVLADPGHDITMGMAYRAKLGDVELAKQVYHADVMPEMMQARLRARFG